MRASGLRGRGVVRRVGRGRRDSRSDVAAAAMVALRAAALLRGGVPLARVWEVLGEEGGAGDADAHDGPAWRVIAAGWRLAEWSGAPIAVVLERIAVALTSLDRLQERRSVLLAGPRATIRLVASLSTLR